MKPAPDMWLEDVAHQCTQLLACVSYRPRWSFELRRDGQYTMVLIMTCRTDMPPRKRLDVPVTRSYEQLLDDLLDAAKSIIEELPDDFFKTTDVRDVTGFLGGGMFKHNASDDTLALAQKVTAALGERRKVGKRITLAEKLENTERAHRGRGQGVPRQGG